MKSFPSLRDFLSPIWRYSLEDKYQDDPDVRVNRIFLRAIDNQLKSVGLKTVQSKADLYLKTSRKEHLDYFGSWIGLERLNKHESDDHYRKRLIHHVEHARSTIPALRQAVSAYLDTNMSNVHIFEPWQYIFETNDVASRTNSQSALYGYYHRPAVINIIINKPSVDPGVVDFINWFRPVGVIFLLTYDNSQYEDVWKMDTDHPVWHDDTIESFIGFEENKVNELSMLDRNNGYGLNPFYLSGHETLTLFDKNKYQKVPVDYLLSEMNSNDVLMDSEYNGDKYYSYLGILHDLLKVSANDSLNDMKLHTDLINPDIYPRLEEKQGLTINVTHHSAMSNMLCHSLDLLGPWKYESGTLYAGDSDKGRNAVRMLHPGAYLTDTQAQFINTNPIPKDTDIMPRMIKGQTYHIGFDVKAFRPGVYKQPYLENVRINVRVDKNQTVELSGEVYSNKWIHFSNTFTYDGSKLIPISIEYSASDSDYEIELSSPMLSQTTSNWQPSYSDLNHPHINPNSQYIYAFINVWAFYFNHIESQENILNKFNDNLTPQKLNQYISNHFNKKYFNLVYKPIVNTELNSRLWIMNFDLNTFINYDSHSKVLGNTNDSYNLSIHHLAPLINHHGLMVVALQLPAFHEDYPVKFYHLNMDFDQYLPNETGIKFYKPYPNMDLWWDITTNHNWNLFGGVNNEAYQYDNRSRAQRHYPIRYIRNYIRNVSYGGDYDNRFITNESLLNGTKLLNGSSKAEPWYLFNWTDRPILPSLTKYGNPVKSISVLGAKTADKYPANILNNLLKNSVFGYFTGNIWGHSSVTPIFDKNGHLTNESSVYMLKDINSDHVWFNNHGAKLWTSTDSIGSRNQYLLSFSAKCKGTQNRMFRVRIKLHTNTFVKNLDKYIMITPQRKQYNITFNTYGIYPNYVTFSWKYIGQLMQTPELFKHLKKYHNTFGEFKKKKITFTDLLTHVIDGTPADNKQNLIEDKGEPVLTSKRRADMIFFPTEPTYTYEGVGNEHITHSKVSEGWNFNGNLPQQYTPAMIPQMEYAGKDNLISSQLKPGYVTNSFVERNSQDNTIPMRLSYIPDDNGDYALGYVLSSEPLKNYIPVKIKQASTGNFITCDVPKKYAYYTASTKDTAEIEFNGIACHLLPKVYIDGKLSNHLPPQINYEGQDTLAYNDIQFGQPVNENELGETFGDLSRYANDFTELKEYGWNFGYLLNHVLLNDNLTWKDLEEKGTTWEQLLNGDYVWNPSVNTNEMLNYAKFNPKADPTTFADLLKNDSNIETFGELHNSSITFAELKAKNVTFKQLKDGFFNDTGYHKEKSDPTFSQANDNNWLFEDGEPFDHSEHCVTIDLGRIYENIDDILVHHGSASLHNAIYDSCVQTSIDGKQWHTWYDNYKGTRSNNKLDDSYVEPNEDPVEFPVAKYDCFNNKMDWNKYPDTSYYYISNDEQHYPVKGLASLLFNDDRHLIPIYSQSYQSTNAILSYYLHSLGDMLKNKLTTYSTSEGKNNKIGKFTRLNFADNTEESHLQEEQSNLDISEPDYFASVPIPESIKLPQLPQPASHALGSMLFSSEKPLAHNTKLLQPMTHHKTYPLILNDNATTLNSWATLQNGENVPSVHHYDRKHSGTGHGSLPNPEYSPYMYNSKLLKFNLTDVITKQYPNLIHNIKKYGIKNVRYFTDGLFARCSTIDLTVKGMITGKWTVSVWDYSKQSWQRTQTNTTNNKTTVVLHNFLSLLHNGTIYFLIMAYVPKHYGNPQLSLENVDLKAVLHLDDVNNYYGGLYPHLNLLYNDDTTYFAKNTGKTEVIKMPWIDKQVLGHKITLSFNMISDTNFGKFQVSINNLHQPYTFIEKGYQNFTYIFDIPKHIKEKHLIPIIKLPHNVANIYVTSVKAEIGIKQSGYTYPISIN